MEKNAKNLKVNEKVIKALTKVGIGLVTVGIISGTAVAVYNHKQFTNSIDALEAVPVEFSMQYSANDYLQESTMEASSYINRNSYKYETTQADAVLRFRNYVEVLDLAQEYGFTNLDWKPVEKTPEIQGLLDKYIVDGEFDFDKYKEAIIKGSSDAEVLMPFFRDATVGAYDEYSEALRNYVKDCIIDYVNIKYDKNYAAEDVTLRYIESSSEGKISYYLDDGRETINLGSNLPTEVAELFRSVNSLTETPLKLSGMHEKLATGNKAYALGSNVYSLLDTNVSARKLKLDVNNKELREANENLVNSYNESIGETSKGRSK